MILDPADLEYLPWPPAPAGGMSTGRFPTGCRLVHRPTGLSVIKTEERHEHKNKAAALGELTLLVSRREAAHE